MFVLGRNKSRLREALSALEKRTGSYFGLRELLRLNHIEIINVMAEGTRSNRKKNVMIQYE